MNDGGPAFPCCENHKIAADIPWTCGMSPRAYFAGLAMQGLMADPNEDGDSETIARKSIAVADALIAALEVKP